MHAQHVRRFEAAGGEGMLGGALEGSRDDRAPGEQLLEQLPGLRSKALRLERGVSDADDLVQDTIERALRSWGRFTPGTNLRSWLHTIMHNLFLDRCRVRNRRELPEDCAPPPVVQPVGEAEPLPPWERVSLMDIHDLSHSLQRPLQDAVELVFFAGLSYAEAAERLRIPRATVGTRLLRARRQLREMLNERLVTERY